MKALSIPPVVLPVLLVSACGGDSGPETGCDGTVPESATFDMSLSHDGTTRAAQVHVPPAYDGTRRLPVVFNFHGLGSNAGEQAFYTDMEARADDEGFIAVHPEGLPNGNGNQAWDAGACCHTEEVDDVGFTEALIGELNRNLCIDTGRLYSTGLSNGGVFSYKLGCALSDRISAIAPVAALNVTNRCSPEEAVPVLHFHGTDDQIVPYDGFAGGNGAVETVDTWVETHLDCAVEPTETFRNGEVYCDTWACGSGLDSALCTVEGGGHTWPGGTVDIPELGHKTDDIDASQTILEFFSGTGPPSN